MNFDLMRIWTFGNGGGLYPQITVRALNYDTAAERACAGWDKSYGERGLEPPVAWTPILIGLRLPKVRKT